MWNIISIGHQSRCLALCMGTLCMRTVGILPRESIEPIGLILDMKERSLGWDLEKSWSLLEERILGRNQLRRARWTAVELLGLD